MRKKVLIVSPYFPYPPYDGGKVRLYNLIKHLWPNNDVYLLSYIESPEMRRYVPAMEVFCTGVYTVVRDEGRRIESAGLPRSLSFFYTPEMIEELERVLREVRPDVVQIDFLVMSQYVDHVKGVPVVYTEHDMSSISFEQSFHDRDLPEKFRFIEWNRLVQFQRAVLERFTGVVVLTGRDARLLAGFAPGVPSVLAPTGVDVRYYRPDGRDAAEGKTLLYVGHYRHYPNCDAVRYFVDEVFPLIAAEMPDVRFVVAGSSPTGEMLALQERDGRITVTGDVKDIREYLRAARVFVAPIRLGGGIKGKVLEAMAAGVPVVATVEASEGIQCTPGSDILVGGGARDFADKTLSLLRDAVLHAEVSGRARRLVEDVYDWKKIAAGLDRYYGTLLAGGGPRSA